MELIRIEKDGRPAEAIDEVSEYAQGVIGATTGLYETVGFEPPWVAYLAVDHGVCVGTCAFKSPPREGVVEIAYHTFPGHEGKGVATSMAALLTAKGRAVDGITVTARTLPEESASTTILAKLGFDNVGEVEDPEDGTVWEWRLP